MLLFELLPKGKRFRVFWDMAAWPLLGLGLLYLLHVFVDPKYASGTYHAVLGLVMLLIAFGIFSGLGWLLNNLFVDDPDSPAAET